ncbi:LGFP repeat-containing protein [Dietzia maris]
MRSDREEIPEGFTKADADKAETMEAALAAQPARVSLLAAPGCQVYWPAPYEVCGAIRDKYNALGGPNSFLLFPKTNEISNPDGIGKRTEFQNGPIYWSPQGGAHPVVNHFLAAWARHQYENGYIGYPTTDEILNPDGIGRRQHFTGSTIYWRLNEAYSVGGAIAEKWHTLGAERGLLGYPISDERKLPDGVGRMNRFERGVIYWHPTTGAHQILGSVLDQWSTAGFELSRYGYPVEDPEGDAVAASQQFQHGRIFGGVPTVPIANTGLSFSIGYSHPDPLSPSIVPNGLQLDSPDFQVKLTTKYPWVASLDMLRKTPSAPRDFSLIFGLPTGYSLNAHPYRTSIINPSGKEIGAIGTPIAYNRQLQNVPITTSVTGNEVKYHFGEPTSARSVLREAAQANLAQAQDAAEGYAVTDAASEYWYENPSTGQYPVATCAGESFDCSRSLRAWQDSTDFARANWSGKLANDRGDATRHCAWMGMTTEASNAGFAQRLGAAHERTPNNPEGPRLMDEYNNITGIGVGLRNEGAPGTIKSVCLRYAREARLVSNPAAEFPNTTEDSLIILEE